MPAFGIHMLLPLVLFALWAVALQFRLAFSRGGAMQRDKRAINTFKPTGDTEALDAVSRAHMNTVENLPVFAVVYGACLLVSADAPVLVLAYVALGARMVQSIVHVASRSPNAVRLRASMQFVQIICFVWLGVAAILAIVNA